MAKYNTVHYLIELLKQYGVKHIVACPGTQNSTFNLLVQEKEDFECYSVVDERSASYVAIGLSNVTRNPVAVTCTGATAARNFLSAMTESYYSNIPLIVLSGYNPLLSKFNFQVQYNDRSATLNDVSDLSITLPEIKDDIDRNHVITAINATLSLAKYNNRPVTINFPASYNYETSLPNYLWKTEYYYDNFYVLKEQLKNRRVAVFIGQHHKFTKEAEIAISNFAKAYNAPVICDHTSNYHGENKVHLTKYRPFIFSHQPEIILDMGRLSGHFNFGNLWTGSKEYWRIQEHYEYKARFDCKLTKLLLGKEETIFSQLTEASNNVSNSSKFYELIKAELNKFTYPDLPFSVLFICQELGKYIPDNCYLNLAVISPQFFTCLFDLPDSVEVFCNLGGYGIDGPLSTAVGVSLASPSKKSFCFLGDLAFFYDMNILGNRHIGKNLRILLENNNEGAIMRTNVTIESHWGSKAAELVTAARHYKNGAKDWAESCGFKYMSARNKDEYLRQIDDFCNKDYDAPVLFEVFTSVDNNKRAVNIFYTHLAKVYPDQRLSKAMERVARARNKNKEKNNEPN